MSRKSLIHGVETLKKFINNAPELPGIYQMLDEEKNILYIGKAKNLKKRLSSYVNIEKLTNRIRSLVYSINSIEVTTVATETEAFLLEANLIKKHNPRYNVMLKDDKSFPYIFISGGSDFPLIKKHRGNRSEKGSYYGPFASVDNVHKTISTLQRTFLLRTCPDSIFDKRTKPCLEYQIKRCSAPCVGKITKDDYQTTIKQAKQFLSGKTKEVQDQLVIKMEELSKNLQYEKAAKIRDRIKALTLTQANQRAMPGIESADVIALYMEGKYCCVQVNFFRDGQNFGSRSYFPSHTEGSEPSEIISAFIARFYQGNPPPKEIIVSNKVEDEDMLTSALSNISGSKVEILIPKAGKKSAAVKNATREAKAALIRKMNEGARQEFIFTELAKCFNLDESPKRIEVFDNSHIMGTSAVGAMIVSGPEGFIKNAYRKYNFQRNHTPGDDYGMLREVLTRRYSKLKQSENAENNSPDLVLIDGGAGHLKVASEVFADLGISEIPFVCIAKGPDRNAGNETFFMPGKKPFKIKKNDSVLFYLQRLRDEAHRFAIMSHRNKRSKSIEKSLLDQIEGVGAKRKKALLNYFGSYSGVEQATVEDLMKVPGIEKNIAKSIYNHIHKI